MYLVFSLFGYFLVMLIFMLVAILTAKHKIAWIFYGAGALIQLFSLMGTQRTASLLGLNITLYWVVYLALLGITAVLVLRRYKANTPPSDYVEWKTKTGWKCSRCGSYHPDQDRSCVCGMLKMNNDQIERKREEK